jgi:hypothetical protein
MLQSLAAVVMVLRATPWQSVVRDVKALRLFTFLHPCVLPVHITMYRVATVPLVYLAPYRVVVQALDVPSVRLAPLAQQTAAPACVALLETTAMQVQLLAPHALQAHTAQLSTLHCV